MQKLINRQYCIKASVKLTSKEIRNSFVDYFINKNGHIFIRSSPVVPYCDPTVPFVNAGMNQFKSIFLGNTKAPAKKVVNYQKCIRVGGKHNDLSVVGIDGYHHTFFEMLGNWSFGDYSKYDACRMSLEFLTHCVGINKERLYITYFGGDANLEMTPDIECRDIWRSLGIPNNRVLPFGTKDNFWEMGFCGPCGPCTEIHVDTSTNALHTIRARDINCGYSDLKELWNLVFIEYSRNEEGEISKLPEKHIDTGMGMERLVSILQNKGDNYGTDLFIPIFKIISKVSRCNEYCGTFDPKSLSYNIDTAYRIVADHSRMITACLADGMLPEQNYKLRRVLRKTILIGAKIFNAEHLIHETIPKVIEILGIAYPEMIKKQRTILEIVSYEQELLKELKMKFSKEFNIILSNTTGLEDIDILDSPGFIPAYKEITSCKEKFSNGIIPGDFLFKLFDTFGLNDNSIKKLSYSQGLRPDMEGLYFEKTRQKEKSRRTSNVIFNFTGNKKILEVTKSCQNTEDVHKYDYVYDLSKNYKVVPIIARILAIFSNGKLINSIQASSSEKFQIITDRTNFFSESGGQESDEGFIIKDIQNGKLHIQIDNVCSLNECTIHFGQFDKKVKVGKIAIGDKVNLIVNEQVRKRNIFHHTANHLLNASIKKICKSNTYQISSKVDRNYLKLDLYILGYKLCAESITSIENEVRKAISCEIPVTTSKVHQTAIWEDEDISTVPGEIYPENDLRLVIIENNDLKYKSKELCCGTHATNTQELQDFCITNFKQVGRCKYSLTAIAENLATQAKKKAEIIASNLNELQNDSLNIPNLELKLQHIKNEVLNSEHTLPYTSKMSFLNKISNIIKKIKQSSKKKIKTQIETQMKNILQEKPLDSNPYLIEVFNSSDIEEVELLHATKLCKDRPIITVALTNRGLLKAKCSVPKDKITKEFTAQDWLNVMAKLLKAQIMTPKNQNPLEICNMKIKKINLSTQKELLKEAIEKAENFAHQFYKY